MDISPLVTLPAVRERSFLDLVSAHWERGEAVLPLDPDLPRAERERILTAMGDGPVPAGVAAVILTSGTGGPPKGVMLSHDAFRAAAEMCHRRLGAERGDRWVCCVPLHHVAGFAMLVRAAALGMGPEIHPGFDPAAIASSKGQFISLVPTMLKRLVEEGVDLTGFKAVLLGGAAIPAEVVRRARESGAKVVTSYGMTETCGGVVYDGLPLDGVRLRIEDGDRIAISSPTLLTGYRARGHVHDAVWEGWFPTHDRGRLSEGHLEVLGRIDGVIVTGGEKVDPDEVAMVLEEHPGVVHAAAFGEPDPEWGQRVVATVVPTAAGVQPEQLKAFVADRLAPYKVPKEIRVAGITDAGG